jgi:predicted  nucleic acid-binding Zn-ribbon protein
MNVSKLRLATIAALAAMQTENNRLRNDLLDQQGELDDLRSRLDQMEPRLDAVEAEVM